MSYDIYVTYSSTVGSRSRTHVGNFSELIRQGTNKTTSNRA
jgi:hypothetical protein